MGKRCSPATGGVVSSVPSPTAPLRPPDFSDHFLSSTVQVKQRATPNNGRQHSIAE